MFSERLSKYGFDFHSMFIVDLLHEFELGVWKAVFTHLLRLLYAQGADGIQLLNKRYIQSISVGYNPECSRGSIGIEISQLSGATQSENLSVMSRGCQSLPLVILRTYFR